MQVGLVLASKFEMLNLLIAVEIYLIQKQKEWIQHNIVTVHKCALSTTPLKELLVLHPDINKEFYKIII